MADHHPARRLRRLFVRLGQAAPMSDRLATTLVCVCFGMYLLAAVLIGGKP